MSKEGNLNIVQVHTLQLHLLPLNQDKDNRMEGGWTEMLWVTSSVVRMRIIDSDLTTPITVIVPCNTKPDHWHGTLLCRVGPRDCKDMVLPHVVAPSQPWVVLTKVHNTCRCTSKSSATRSWTGHAGPRGSVRGSVVRSS